MKKLPIGIQTFSKLIEENYLYFDKTKDLLKLLGAGNYLFLSRSRRFGKSLLIRTLDSIFKGKKELFLVFISNGKNIRSSELTFPYWPKTLQFISETVWQFG